MIIKHKTTEDAFRAGYIAVRINSTEEKDEIVKFFSDITPAAHSFNPLYDYIQIENYNGGDKRIICATGPRQCLLINSLDEFCEYNLKNHKILEVQTISFLKSIKPSDSTIKCHIDSSDIVQLGLYKFRREEWNKIVEFFKE